MKKYVGGEGGGKAGGIRGCGGGRGGGAKVGRGAEGVVSLRCVSPIK